MVKTTDKWWKAFEKCIARQWNLSYDCLTGVAMRCELRELRDNDPKFWEELTTKKTQVPPESVPQPEDEDMDLEDVEPLDDCNVTLQAVIEEIVKGKVRKGYVKVGGQGFVADTVAEGFDDEPTMVDKPVGDEGGTELGRGKRRKWANQLYDTKSFWRHNLDDSDDPDT